MPAGRTDAAFAAAVPAAVAIAPSGPVRTAVPAAALKSHAASSAFASAGGAAAASAGGAGAAGKGSKKGGKESKDGKEPKEPKDKDKEAKDKADKEAKDKAYAESAEAMQVVLRIRPLKPSEREEARGLSVLAVEGDSVRTTAPEVSRAPAGSFIGCRRCPLPMSAGSLLSSRFAASRSCSPSCCPLRLMPLLVLMPLSALLFLCPPLCPCYPSAAGLARVLQRPAQRLLLLQPHLRRVRRPGGPLPLPAARTGDAGGAGGPECNGLCVRYDECGQDLHHYGHC